MRLLPHVISVVLALTLASSATAGLADRKTLVLEGRTIDSQGFPIHKVRVWVDGVRHVSATSDGNGQFSLRVPLGTPNDLRRGPLRLAIQAERRGFRFALPSGDRRLALEIGLQAASGGLGRCVARSNDARFAASAARVVGLDGDVVGLMVVNFLGVKGEPAANEPWPRLENVAQAALSFAVEGVPGIELAPPAPAETPSPEMARPSSPLPQGRDQPSKRRNTEARERRRVARQSEAERALEEIRARAAADSAAEVARAMERAGKRAARIQEQAQRAIERSTRGTTQKPIAASEQRPMPRATSPLLAPRDTVAAQAPSALPGAGESAAEPGRAGAASADSTIERWRDAQWHASVAPAGEPAPPSPKPRETRSSKRERRSGKDQTRPTAAAPREREIVPSAPDADERGAVERSLRPSPPPSPPPATSPPVTGPAIFPEPPLNASRARTRPLVIRNPAPTGRSPSDSCECRVEGTVEVESEEPLKNRERIEVSLQWYPQLRDTVELFMGSPRRFKLPPAPCGPQRLRLRVLTDGRFDVPSREAMAAFRCTGERVVQPRIVLVPR